MTQRPRKPSTGWSNAAPDPASADSETGVDRPDTPAPVKRPAPSADLTDASRGVRLQKVLAAAGIGSRRACESLVEEGAVSVNGRVVVQLPAWVDPIHDRVEVSGRLVSRAETPVYVMLFKPRGVVCTNNDPDHRRLAVELVVHPSGVRLYPVGRLDRESSGLLLLTNDGELANRLTHPRYGVHKKYEVTVEGSLDADEVRKLERGVFLNEHRQSRGRRPGKKAAASQLTLLHRGRDRTRVLMELTEGRNRQVRRMLLYVGHKVRKLRRVELGPLKLKGLRPGQWRDLLPKEVEQLRRAAGLTDAPGVTRRPKRPPR